MGILLLLLYGLIRLGGYLAGKFLQELGEWSLSQSAVLREADSEYTFLKPIWQIDHCQSDTAEKISASEEENTQIDYGTESVFMLEDAERETSQEQLAPTEEVVEVMQGKLTFAEMKNRYFFVDASTSFPKSIADPDELMKVDLRLEKKDAVQILIFHTHSAEAYADSEKGNAADGVFAAGEELAAYFRAAGYQVLHDTTRYDMKNGQVNRDVAYSQALEGVSRILAQYPDIAVVIDLHRDSGHKRVANVNGTEVAQVMFFNGLSRTPEGPIERLYNENLTYNLAGSLQAKQIGDERFPGFLKKIYLKSYRYNMHLRARSFLIEVGTGENTVAQAKAAMKPLSEIFLELLAPDK